MNEYEEINRFLDDEADSYISTDDILKSNNLTFDDALKSASKFRDDFFNLLKNCRIESGIPEIILIDLCKQMEVCKDNDMLNLYCMAITDKGLLFENLSDNEQRILLWLEQKKDAELLINYLQKVPKYKALIDKLAKSIKADTAQEIDLEEQANLYNMALEHGFIYKNGRNNIFLNNVGELIRQVNSNNYLEAVKPYIYSVILCRKHKMMLEREEFSPNIKDIFKVKSYKIDSDNGKNFDTYQSYLELYEQLKRHYGDECDIGFSDYCFANLGNLSQWYYQNCELNEDIPMNLKDKIGLHIKENQFIECGLDFDNPVLEIAFENTLNDNPSILKEFVNQRYNREKTEETVEQFCKLSGSEKISKDTENTKKYAESYLMNVMEDNIKNMLIDAIEEFI